MFWKMSQKFQVTSGEEVICGGLKRKCVGCVLMAFHNGAATHYAWCAYCSTAERVHEFRVIWVHVGLCEYVYIFVEDTAGWMHTARMCSYAYCL